MPGPHPMRRISTGSLSSLARSQDRQHASPSGLNFLQPALAELADEAAALATNIERLNELHDALGTFNESFAGWLFALKMNAFCVEWPQGPDPISFARAEKLAPPPEPTLTAPAQPDAPPPPSPTSGPASSPADQTYRTVNSSFDEPAPPPRKSALANKRVTSGTVKKPAGAAAKKKRELEIASLIETLPLEYRTGPATNREAMERVIGRLMEQPEGLTLRDLVQAPELPQPRANKCLIALVAKKLVAKNTVGGLTIYKWIGA